MAQNNAKNWEAARMQLVERRQAIIDALAEGYAKAQSENHVDFLVRVQAGIDALDKAKDEVLRSAPIQEQPDPLLIAKTWTDTFLSWTPSEQKRSLFF
jgi:hypothetical protein